MPTPVALNFPGGSKIFGSNMPNRGDQWAGWDWTNVMKPWVDYQIACGANCIRWFGDVQQVFLGNMTLAQYLARTDQLGSYIKSKGGYCYPCLIEPVQNLGSTTQSSWLNTITNLVTMIEASTWRSNVVGYDIANEPEDISWSTTFVANIYSAVKALTSLSCATNKVSGSAGGPPFPVDTSTGDSIIAGMPGNFPYATWCDHVCVHIYYEPSSNALAPLASNFPGFDVIVGEFGCSSSYTDTDRTAMLTDTLIAVKNASAHCLVFDGVNDLATPPLWGLVTDLASLYSSTSVPATCLPYRQARGNSSIAAPTTVTVDATGLITWTPMQSTGYVTDTLHINGTQVFSDLFSLFYYPTILGKQMRLDASATNATTTVINETIWPGRLPPKLLRRRVQATFR